MELRPAAGGFLRPFGTAWFIIEFLKGTEPETAGKGVAGDIGGVVGRIINIM